MNRGGARTFDRDEERHFHCEEDLSGVRVFAFSSRALPFGRGCRSIKANTTVSTLSITRTRRTDTATRHDFERLARQWKRETAVKSNLEEIVMHPAYQRIMAMGPAALPLILEDLKRAPAHWFWALHNLVPPGTDPAEGAITIAAARDAWLKWGMARGLI